METEKASSKKVADSREQFKKECEERKQRRKELQTSIFRQASFTSKIKMTIRSWFGD